LLPVARLVDGAQLVDEQPAAGDSLVRLGELLDERSFGVGERVGSASQQEALPFQPGRRLPILFVKDPGFLGGAVPPVP
jgi:hypothetical protein